ncbi:MAG: type II toxin-antitoxin system ParD family antitoxin [Hyphomicrobium zavarzinii]|uniref:ribbon-helix-helix domain-containing protein n=1 Tax=Hyphomicrobium zavarzinii TaxID=48292 RepID=UPI001A4C884F|nr:type II toxin-antitoxin system ParD family antitoxin [Hyphomicrobium zavarzinii]MBL8845611.1 type II toxin-antitoxin system ParD family antitoxin [Hyphomicrobium zavarzinii]
MPREKSLNPSKYPDGVRAIAAGRRSKPCTLNFALTPDLKEWVRGQVAAGAYSSASQYICTLIRRDQEQVSMLDHLRGMLHYQDASGVPTRDDIAALGRRQDGAAWEAVFKHILRLKRAAAGRDA